MKDKWLKDLHDRMSEFEMDAPDNLWADIENAEKKRNSKPKPVIRLWIRRYSSVAAAIVALAIGGYIFFNKPGNIDFSLETSDNATDLISQVKKSSGNPINPANSTAPALLAALSRIQNSALPIKVATSNLPDNNAMVESPDTIGNTNQKNDASTEEKTGAETSPDSIAARHRSSDYPIDGNDYRTLIACKHNSQSRFSVGVFSSGGINSNISQTSVSDRLTSAGPDGSDWEDAPMLGILLFNQGKEITTDIKHRQPVRTGLSFNYKLTDRFGLGTGISYTNLTSSIRSGSDSHYFSGEQKLHYIGIPVNVTCDIFRWKRLQLYASAGVLGEKCVSGKVTTDYVLDNNTVEIKEENIEKKPFQFSLNATVGILFDITGQIGVYAEPGVSYYFDDGTDIKTIYKDKPLNLNLNFGLRFTIGNKTI